MSDGSKFMVVLRSDLSAAMGARSVVRVRTIRSLMSAIANAESVSSVDEGEAARIGAFQGDTTRRELTFEEINEIVQLEIDERERASVTYRTLDRVTEADVLGEEVATLRAYLDR